MFSIARRNSYAFQGIPDIVLGHGLSYGLRSSRTRSADTCPDKRPSATGGSNA